MYNNVYALWCIDVGSFLILALTFKIFFLTVFSVKAPRAKSSFSLASFKTTTLGLYYFKVCNRTA